jgi:hypothetical protein
MISINLSAGVSVTVRATGEEIVDWQEDIIEISEL